MAKLKASYPALFFTLLAPLFAAERETLPAQSISVIGAPTSGPFIEGVLGSTRKSCRHRFYCHSASPAQGFLGPQNSAEPLSLRDQPGVFPAPSMGQASLTFSFDCQEPHSTFTPVIVRPDGTVFFGHPMSNHNSPQSLVVSSPAQKGIYTIFILSHQNENIEAQATVRASISTQPEFETTLQLKSFNPKSDDPSLISAEFFYLSAN